MKPGRIVFLAFLAAMIALGAHFAGLLPSQEEPEARQSSFIATIPESTRAWIVAPGRIEPVSEELRLGFDTPGILAAMHVEEGDSVSQGAVLAELVNVEHQARLDAATARVAAAKAEVQRTMSGSRPEEKREALAALEQAETVMRIARIEAERRATLLAQGLVDQETTDRAARDYETAAAEHEMRRQQLLARDKGRREDIVIALSMLEAAQNDEAEARALLEKTRIHAPIDGKVLWVHRRAGEMVSVFFDSPVLTVGDTSTLRLRVEVDERDVGRLRMGQRAYATAEAFGEARFWGTVTRIGGLMGRKTVHSDSPSERKDTKVLETLVTLDERPPLPIGLRMEVYIENSR